MTQLFALKLLLAAAAAAVAEASCPDFSGSYSDRDLFLSGLEQRGCGELDWTSSVHPKNPNPPSPPKPPETTKLTIDCKKHQNVFQMESVCWNKEVLEIWTYSKNFSGSWVPFSIRRLYLNQQNGNLHEDGYLTDSTGDERKYFSAVYYRQAP